MKSMSKDAFRDEFFSSSLSSYLPNFADILFCNFITITKVLFEMSSILKFVVYFIDMCHFLSVLSLLSP